jgi:hypothetical protein
MRIRSVDDVPNAKVPVVGESKVTPLVRLMKKSASAVLVNDAIVPLAALETVNLLEGLVVPMPTLPVEVIRIRSVAEEAKIIASSVCEY